MSSREQGYINRYNLTSRPSGWVFLVCQLIFCRIFVNYSTADYYFFFTSLSFIFFKFTSKQYRMCRYSWLFKKTIICKFIKTKLINCQIINKDQLENYLTFNKHFHKVKRMQTAGSCCLIIRDLFSKQIIFFMLEIDKIIPVSIALVVIRHFHEIFCYKMIIKYKKTNLSHP